MFLRYPQNQCRIEELFPSVQIVRQLQSNLQAQLNTTLRKVQSRTCRGAALRLPVFKRTMHEQAQVVIITRKNTSTKRSKYSVGNALHSISLNSHKKICTGAATAVQSNRRPLKKTKPANHISEVGEQGQMIGCYYPSRQVFKLRTKKLRTLLNNTDEDNCYEFYAAHQMQSLIWDELAYVLKNRKNSQDWYWNWLKRSLKIW